jgi:hypothetical protein
MMIELSAHQNYWLIEPRGPLSRDDFAVIAKQIDPIIENNGRVDGLIIKTRNFPGWESLGDLIEHFRFVRDHHRAIDRVALVTDTPLAHIFPAIAGHFVSADVRQFDFDDYADAVTWMRSSGGQD